MIFSYRTRRILSRILGMFAAVVALAVILWMFWLLGLQKYVRYTPQGVVLDFSISQQVPPGTVVTGPKPGPSLPVHYGKEEDDPAVNDQPELKQFSGYYVTVDELVEDLESVRQRIRALPAGTAILLDVKGTWGYFFYPSAVGLTYSESFNMEVMDAFFREINDLDLYAIARLPAFQDYDFGRNNFSAGLAATGGGYLWSGENNCYWLNPTSDTVLTYLIQITRELRDMGFDEVLFKDFCFPDTEDIIFEGDRNEAIAKAAKTLVTACGTGEFAVSFLVSDPAFRLPEGNCRMYLENVPAAEVADKLALMGITDPALQAVFFAQTNDTRYEVAGVLRPLEMAQ